ncbi:MAG TPA: LysR family transcriptional regulator [Gemmatimonadaceae bacterium]|nr:LysR family transcriptional regulator [Gemmatimonadaceae bacterium]
MADDLNGMAVFVAVAETKGFRAAGERLRVSGSAVSQALRRLEERLGVALVPRTTRSMRLTEAGERLYAAARPALDELRAAVAALGEMGEEPRGTLRLHVAGAAESFLSGPLLAGFVVAHPRLHLDLFVSDEPVDIVAAGYDGGIRLGEVIEKDMIAVPVSGDLRLLVVGSPSYFARHPKPKHPRDLVHHECINWHPTPESPPYRWEFTENGRDFSVDVRARVLTNDPGLNVRLARAGAGLTLADQSRSRDGVASGELVPVLEEFSTPFPGFYLYYPQRRHASPALRALVDYLRASRGTAPRRRGARGKAPSSA